MQEARRLAMLAFVFHGFGIRWIAKQPLGARLFGENVVAVLATIAAIFAARALAPPDSRGLWGFVAFIVGHFAWGTYLSVRIYQRALRRLDDRADRAY